MHDRLTARGRTLSALGAVMMLAGAVLLSGSTQRLAASGANRIDLSQNERVDLELVLAIDTSASVDSSEYRLQMEGVRLAFLDPAIISAIRSTGPTGIAVTVVHWSSASQQRQVVPWTRIHDERSSHAFAGMIATRGAREYADSTGIGSVIQYGERLIRRNRFDGRRKSIDVSGDGINNSGIQPNYVRDAVVASGVTINGLAILSDNPYLFQYFDQEVIGGPGAFVLSVNSYSDIISGTRNKLLREISVAVSQAPDHFESKDVFRR